MESGFRSHQFYLLNICHPSPLLSTPIALFAPSVLPQEPPARALCSLSPMQTPPNQAQSTPPPLESLSPASVRHTEPLRTRNRISARPVWRIVFGPCLPLPLTCPHPHLVCYPPGPWAPISTTSHVFVLWTSMHAAPATPFIIRCPCRQLEQWEKLGYS